jgi:hypothetical protein
VEQVLPRRVWAGEVEQTMCTHVSKCKNDKIKEKKNDGPYVHSPFHPQVPGKQNFKTKIREIVLKLFLYE